MADSIKIFTTGGTIDKVMYSYDHLNYVVGEPQITQILSEVNLGVDFSVESLMKKDSLEISDSDRALLKKRVVEDPSRWIVITHGTDTMPETAKVLSNISEKTIVLTGAMLPARFVDSDAKFNIGAAIVAVQILKPGVHIVINGRVFPASGARKNRDKSIYETL